MDRNEEREGLVLAAKNFTNMNLDVSQEDISNYLKSKKL